MSAALVIILNLFILETLLSIDNAAVLSLMVIKLPEVDRSKALKYGIFGAFAFRGLCLFIAAWLVKIVWLKIVGGIYLVYLYLDHFSSNDQAKPVEVKKLFGLNAFWSTVIMVEIMDLAFSLDNVFAAVALTNNIWLILIGVFAGIVSMRFIANKFTVLMTAYPSLVTSAFFVILFLGMKLILFGIMDFIGIKNNLDNDTFNLWFSIDMTVIFFLPLLPAMYKKLTTKK